MRNLSVKDVQIMFEPIIGNDLSDSVVSRIKETFHEVDFYCLSLFVRKDPKNRLEYQEVNSKIEEHDNSTVEGFDEKVFRIEETIPNITVIYLRVLIIYSRFIHCQYRTFERPSNPFPATMCYRTLLF